jgi:hypothetical protein
MYSIGQVNAFGVAFTLMSGPNVDNDNIKKLIDISISNNIDGNENRIRDIINQYLIEVNSTKNINNLAMVGSIILLDGNVYKIQSDPACKKLIDLLTPSVFYYSYIVHETIHSIQINDLGNKFIHETNISKGYYKGTGLDNENFMRRGGISNPDNVEYTLQSYYFNNKEAESHIEQRNFILSIKRNPIIELFVRKYLSRIGFVYKI